MQVDLEMRRDSLEHGGCGLEVMTIGEQYSEGLIFEAAPREGFHPVLHELELSCKVAPVHRGSPDYEVRFLVGLVDGLHVVVYSAVVGGLCAAKASLTWRYAQVINVEVLNFGVA